MLDSQAADIDKMERPEVRLAVVEAPLLTPEKHKDIIVIFHLAFL